MMSATELLLGMRWMVGGLVEKRTEYDYKDSEWKECWWWGWFDDDRQCSGRITDRFIAKLGISLLESLCLSLSVFLLYSAPHLNTRTPQLASQGDG